MFTTTADKILPCTVTGSWPRPRWFDDSMFGRPLDTCMMDVRFREKFQDALATVLSDQERAGLDILTHGDLHCDDDLAGRSWHHYPLQRWAGFSGDFLQSEETRSPGSAIPRAASSMRSTPAGAGLELPTRSNIGLSTIPRSGGWPRARPLARCVLAPVVPRSWDFSWISTRRNTKTARKSSGIWPWP